MYLPRFPSFISPFCSYLSADYILALVIFILCITELLLETNGFVFIVSYDDMREFVVLCHWENAQAVSKN